MAVSTVELETRTSRSAVGEWFPAAWAAVVFFHLAANPLWLRAFHFVGLLQVAWIAAAIAFARSRNPTMHIVAFALHTQILLFKAPLIGNHEVLIWLVELVGIGAILSPRETWMEKWTQGARAVFTVAYFAFAFSKFNTDFLDPVVSCAVVFAEEFGLDVSGSPSAGYLLAWGTALIEGLIALFLLVPRLRSTGAAIGIGFHFLLALDPESHVFDFSSVLLVLFLLFLPDISPQMKRLLARIPVEPKVLVGLVLAAQFALTLTDAPIWLVAWPVWLVLGGTTTVVVLREFVAHSTDSAEVRPPPTFSGLTVASALVVLLAMLNAVSPYVEAKTAFSFNMYSNLRVVDGESNHLLIRSPLPVRDTPETVEVLSADADFLQRYLNGTRVPIINVQKFLVLAPDTEMTIELPDGETVVIGPDEGLPPDLADVSSEFMYRFAMIRSFSGSEPQTCRRFQGALF